MGRRSRRSKEVELFNFSFLDILACVIGLLIFILSIVVVSAGGQRDRQTDGRLSNAEHELQQAREAAERASDRRKRAEELLSEESHDFADPKAAAAAVRGETALFDNEAANLDAATATARARTDSLQQALRAVGLTPSANPEASEIQEQLRRLDADTVNLRNRTAEEHRKALANVRQVEFYVPHVREVHRNTLWIEVSKDRLWCIESDDYLSIPINDQSTEFKRRAGVEGTSISSIVSGSGALPSSLDAAVPEDTVIEVALHPDGFEAFRKLRKWAWDKGFGVNWEPQDDNPIVLTHTTHALEQ